MVVIYPAVFTKEEEGGYSVYFPDFKSCYTEGETLEEALLMAQEVLGLYYVALEEDNAEIPVSSDPLNIKTNKNEFISVISVNVAKYRRQKSVRKNLTIPQWLNDEAEKRHINFSSVLQKALTEEISSPNLKSPD